MSKRFDRYVANPEQVALPQCYDEFLDREILRCPVEDCDWEGKFLSCHVNFTHGIAAEKFKEMAGFNRRTGLVSKDLSKLMSERKQGHRIAGCREEAVEKSIAASKAMTPEQRAIRLEGREHYQKANALRLGTHNEVSPAGRENVRRSASESIRRTWARGREHGFGVAACLVCGLEFQKTSYGPAKLCPSRECHRKHHHENWVVPRKWEIACSFCSKLFMGSYMQFKNSEAGKLTYCDTACRKAGVRLSMVRRRATCLTTPDNPA
jgi:hypothetical protein